MNIIVRSGLVIAGCALCIHIFGDDTLAAESGGTWRSTYDLIMRWANFLILAFIIFKFGKKPLINFMKSFVYLALNIGLHFQPTCDCHSEVIHKNILLGKLRFGCAGGVGLAV